MKKKCLLILPRQLYPYTGGYAIKTLNTVKLICNEFDTKIIVIGSIPLHESERSLYENCSREFKYFYFPKWRFLLNALRGLFSKEPIQCHYYKFNKVADCVRLWAEKQDVVIATLIRTVPYFLSIDAKVVKVIDMIDSIALNYQRSHNKTKSLLWRIIYKIEFKRLMKYEEYAISNCDVAFFVNKSEADFWRKVGKTVWSPMAIKEELFTYTKIDPIYSNSIAFFGKMDYQPNIDAIKWFLENVYIKLNAQPSLYIVGTSPTKELLNLKQKYPNVVITGYLDDPYIILNSCEVIIAPMQTGGGMQNKVLEMMALGKVNVLSSLAASPIIGAKNGEHFIIADSPEEYIRIFDQIKNLEIDCRKIGKNARQFVSERYRLAIYSEIIKETLAEQM